MQDSALRPDPLGVGAPPEPRAGRIPVPVLVRVLTRVLVVGWLVMTLAIVLGAERHGDFASLEWDITNGRIDTVHAAGGIPPGANGYSVVELRWSRHGLRYHTEIVQTRGRQSDEPGWSGAVTGRVEGDLTTYLQSLDPDVRVVPSERVTGTSLQVVGWRMSGWLLWPYAVLGVLTLGVMVRGSEPRVATRWAWFWLFTVLGPFVALAFLLLGRPASAGWTPALGRRLTGGWMFLLTVALANAFRS